MTFRSPTWPAVAVLLLVGCGRPNPAELPPGDDPPQSAPQPAKTAVAPDPGVFNDRLKVTLTTDVPATLFVTTDGTDPHAEGPERRFGPSPLELELTATTTLTFFSVTEAGAEEVLGKATFTRAGGKKGSIFGTVVVGTVAVGKPLALFVDGSRKELPTPPAAGEVPFVVDGLSTGNHRLVAMSDRNGDGNFWPLVDYSSDTHVVALDLADPYKASAENVRILLGTSERGLGTLKGTISLPDPPVGQNLSLAALGSDALGGGMDPVALLAQLQSGYRVFTNSRDRDYPYVITDLKPGRYIPVPMLIGFGDGGLAMNLIAHLLRPVTLNAGETATADFKFGPVGLTGAVTLKPQTAPTQPLVYGIVAARHSSLAQGLQVVLMPTVFLPGQNAGELKGNYAGTALRDNATFAMRVFTNLDSPNPLTSAFAWAMNPFAPQPPQATLPTGSVDVKKDITVP